VGKGKYDKGYNSHFIATYKAGKYIRSATAGKKFINKK
jgi:hypothetical protein